MKASFTYWKEPDGMYLGYLNDFPDHWTQGVDLEDLKEHLQDLFKEFRGRQVSLLVFRMLYEKPTSRIAVASAE